MEENENKVFKKILEWCLSVVFAVIIALISRYYIGSPTIVMHESMYPTLQGNQRVWLSRVKRITNGEYERGDIITFEAPNEIQSVSQIDIFNPVAVYDNEPEKIIDKFVYYVLELNKISYIKRIIAVEGDWVQVKEGKVYINGEILEEAYLPEETTTKAPYYYNVVVPEGYVYVMGDNRAESLDSRTFGCIPVEKIEGKVLFRYWPITKICGF